MALSRRFAVLRLFLLCCVLFGVVIFSAPVNAHLAAGADRQIGDMLLDFGYDPAQPIAGQQSALMFSLVNVTTNETLPLDYAWVRIATESSTLFAGKLYPDKTGSVLFTLQFPDSGQYDIAVQFEQNGSVVAQTSYPLIVQKSASSNVQTYMLFALALILILVLVYIKYSIARKGVKS
jgi:hypothetical protein